MKPREWVDRTKALLKKLDPELKGTEIYQELDLLQALHEVEIDWRDRQDDVPREIEVGRLLCEQEREALQELVCAMLQTDPVSQTADAPEAFVKMAARIRAKITGQTTEDIMTAASGGNR